MTASRKVAVVTGVSRMKGIGRAICLELAKRGHDIFFTYWTPYDEEMPWGSNHQEPNMIQQEIRKLGVHCEKLELDLAAEGAFKTLLDAVEQEMGDPSVLINNATYSTESSIDTLNAKVLDKHYALNMKATTLLIAAFVRRFKFSSGGRIVNLTSGQSLGPMPGEIAYALTKSAIEMLTKTLTSEIAEKGITINAVNPGPNDTGWMDNTLKKDLVERFPMSRIGQPEDAAKLIGFLVSEEGEWVTGQVIHSEGGFVR